MNRKTRFTAKSRGASAAVLEDVLVRSRRRCALCYLGGDEDAKVGTVAHIRTGSGGEAEAAENLIFLCANHHAAIDQARSSVTPEVLIAARDALYRHIERTSEPVGDIGPAVVLLSSRNAALEREVADYLRNTGVEPLVLADQPGLGRTILEKLDSTAHARYAIALLSPEDQVAQDDNLHGSDHVQPRARQNIYLEIGYLMGRLGRNRVCLLYQEPLELPSDVLGLLYVRLDASGRWRHILAQELRDAGISVRQESRT